MTPSTASFDVLSSSDFPIPIPSQNYPNDGAYPSNSTSAWATIPTPDSVWVRLSVVGKVELSHNPEYLQLCEANGFYVCPPRIQPQSVGPDGIDDAGQTGQALQIFARITGSNSQTVYFQADGSAKDPVVYVWIAKGSILQVHRNGVTGVQSCTSSTGTCGTVEPFSGTIPYYNLAGEQSLRVEVVTTPVSISASPRFISSGETTRGTAQTAMPFNALRWYFVPDDTLATPRYPPYLTSSYGALYLYGCNATSSPTCDYAPAKSGRLYIQASAYGGAYAAVAASDVIWVDKQPTLEVSCTPNPVVRGENITCTATAESGGESVEVSGWRFEADGFSNTRSTGATELSWSGIIVRGGRLIVDGSVDGGTPQTAETEISVASRDWSGLGVAPNVREEAAPHHLPTHPDSVHDLGDIHQSAYLELIPNTNWAPVLSGPNSGLAYLTDLPVTYEGLIHVNRTALSVGSDFWTAQPTADDPSTSVIECTRNDVAAFIPVIERHEGIGLDPSSHAYLYLTKFNSLIGPQLEDVTGTTLSEIETEVETRASAVHNAAAQEGALADQPPHLPQWCTFNYNY